MKCNLKYKNKTYKVKGLEEVKTFDAFKDLQLSFNGISPGGAVSFDYTGSDLTSADFQTDASNGTLANGDKIKVYLDKSMADSYAANISKALQRFGIYPAAGKMGKRIYRKRTVVLYHISQ